MTFLVRTASLSDTLRKWSDSLGNQGQKAFVFNTLAFQDVKFLTKVAFYKKIDGNKNMDQKY